MGYFASNGVDYSFYAFGNINDFTTGGAGGRAAAGPPPEVNTHVGLGGYGGVMGGWVRGSVYGTTFAGPRYGVYVDGKTLTNDLIAQLQVAPTGERVATYVPGSLSVDVSARGRGQLTDGVATITFPAAYRAILSAAEPPTVTVTPLGPCPGLYLAEATAEGFTVRTTDREARVAFTWIAIGTRRGAEQPAISPEILARDFDPTMRQVMHHELDPTPGKAIWWDGRQVRHDAPPAHQPDPTAADLSRPQAQASAPK